MNFEFVHNLPWFKVGSPENFGSEPQPKSSATQTVHSSSRRHMFTGIRAWGSSFSMMFTLPLKPKGKALLPVINAKLQQDNGNIEIVESGLSFPRFRPYVAKYPWHKGVRAFLSQLFPRYGHYCGPNWSSGKDRGSLIWDRRPIDWLDLCCYCHDIGYDTNDQAKLLKADIAFLECLENPKMSIKGDARIANIYRTMCITGKRTPKQPREYATDTPKR